MQKFTQNDITQITNRKMDINTVLSQIERFETGFPYADIIRPATIDDGIQSPDTEMRKKYCEIYDNYRHTHKIVKFVPASGAATRMFKDLFTFLSTGTINDTTRLVLDNLNQFAFYNELRKVLPNNATPHEIISYIVNDIGLNYGQLPKALIPFHTYSDTYRTAMEEHLTEGAQYAHGADGVNIHFTVSPEHIHGFETLLNQVIEKYEQKFSVKYNIEMSQQNSATDTIAVNMDNTPLRNSNDELVFRPAGHGALIENLNTIDADIIFIKNIDNVCVDSLRNNTIEYKKILAGILIDLQQRAFDYINALRNDANPTTCARAIEFITHDLCVQLPDKNIDADKCIQILDRPIRVCGVVKNTGAPGGGPFWTRDTNGNITLQIIESSQIAPDARDIMNASSHFNPVDLVCGTRTSDGKKFNLMEFIDEDTGFISEKSYGATCIRAMERPGLWNGAMARWNTIFVQVPLSTFTPVKVISDLLTDAHNTKK